MTATKKELCAFELPVISLNSFQSKNSFELSTQSDISEANSTSCKRIIL